jgi:phosphoribosyl-AMP cyclohydrolase / phosphoribosyl-ATP pyrophosphohydrolase
MSDRKPLVLCGPDGRPLGVLEENEKGFRKTVEQGHLWAVHPGTGRLLPFYETTSASVVERDGWYEARLAAVPSEDLTKADALSPASGGSDAHGPGATDTEAAGAPPVSATPDSDHCDIGEVLTGLAAVIASRHRELPEGSYTTHLFTSGAEKIRKKTGEEAVELLLAASRETVISESADLIYHLLVLLESEDIALDDLAAELVQR